MTTLIEKLISKPSLINNKNRKTFYDQRNWHPLVQFKWDAETWVEPVDPKKHKMTGLIHFPNGSTRTYERTTT